MEKVRLTHVIGIDEVGRGPLAGPVAVCAVVVPLNFDWGMLPLVGDSKKVSSKNREAIFAHAKTLKDTGALDYCVAFESAKTIDRMGIVPAITKALERALSTVVQHQKLTPTQVAIKLDGGLKASPDYVHQETLIKGDSTEKVIGLASIIAKVSRDRHMETLDQKAQYEEYEFAVHKGYGTKKHRTSIMKHGLSDEHRASFCKNIKIVL